MQKSFHGVLVENIYDPENYDVCIEYTHGNNYKRRLFEIIRKRNNYLAVIWRIIIKSVLNILFVHKICFIESLK